MTNEEAIKLTTDTFNLIKISKTIKEIEDIPDKVNIPIKSRMKIDSYPKIDFFINQNEILSLIANKILDDDLNFTTDITSKLTDPLTKLLYAISWKNGDLKKVKHIVKGILECEDENSNQEEALVFYQFGKYLTKVSGQPIIDQHVIRAFATYKLSEFEKLSNLRQIEIISKKHKYIINLYKNWLISDELTTELKSIKDYTYYIDKLLFATGKTIKQTVKQKIIY